ncbi:MAG: hypothetical protein HOE90_11085 [Bacteriovoracaceae bacterium]|nr:hypothetical protein [Bacteriovoracaceae bacterium]
MKSVAKTDQLFFGALIGLTMVGGMLTSPYAYSQDFEDYGIDEDTYYSDPLDVEGNVKKRPSQADKLKKMRAAYEQKNENMVRKKIEDARMAEERKLTNKLKNMFNGNGMTLDEPQQVDRVQTKQAAVQKVEAPVPAQLPAPKSFKSIKITPHVGATMMKSTNFDFESTFTSGINLESRVHERIGVGIGFTYTKMTINDYTNSNNSYYGGGNAYSQPYYSSYSPYYGNYQGWYGDNYGAREIKYTGMKIDINGKFYLIATGMIQPYLGAGLGFNRTSLKYDQNNQSTYTGSYTPYSNVQFGNESYSGSFLSGELGAGTDLMFTDTFGAAVGFKYSKGLTSSFNEKKAYSSQQNPDQTWLNELGQEVDDAHNASFFAGLNVSF